MIQTAAIIGLGAVGGMYASLLRRHLKREQVFGIADAERICRYEKEGIFVNGERLDITYLADTDPRIRPADLLIFATKYGSLTEAVKSATKNHIGVLIDILKESAFKTAIQSALHFCRFINCINEICFTSAA